jgi:enoyl-CoA hydratase/carnithine racemase
VSIAVEQRGCVRIFSFDRPEKRNALGLATIESLLSSLREAEADPEVRGIVLSHRRAEGQLNVFVSGGDLDELAGLLDRDDGADAVISMGEHLRALETRPRSRARPSVGAANCSSCVMRSSRRPPLALPFATRRWGSRQRGEVQSACSTASAP